MPTTLDLARDEGVEHGEGVLGLVARDHVAGVEDTQERETVGGLEGTGGGPGDGPVVGGGLDKVRLVGPVHRLRPRLVPEPVADVVLTRWVKACEWKAC